MQKQIRQFTQVKVSVDRTTASAFKATCVAANVSMASELSHFMINYSKGMITRKDALDFSTRRKRRAIVKRIISELEQLKDAEEDLIDNAPENLREAPVYTLTDHFISILDDAINLLQEMVP